MTIAFFLTYEGPPAGGEALRTWFRVGPARALAQLPGVRALDVFSPEPSQDPYLDDGAGPLLIAQVDFDDVGWLETTLATPALFDGTGDPRGIPVADCRVTCEAFESRFSPVGDDAAPKPRTAPLSYVVRYARPAEDEAAFVDYYLANHPALLGELPGIRNVICYVPMTWNDPLGITRSDHMFGNEVVFDSAAALNTALAAEIRHRLRDDYKSFPPFTGRVTHYAMARRSLAG